MHQKSCKSAKNRQENFIHTLFCNLDPSEQTDFTENCTRGTSFAHARVFQQRFSFFAVTSVTHLLKNTDLFWKKRLLPTSTSPSIFHPLFFISALQKQTNSNKLHIPLYFNLLREPLWHLWQQKHKNSCLRVYVRVREKLLAPIISHFSTRYVHSPSSPIKIPSPPTFFFTSSRCLLIHFRLSTKRRLVFHKTTSHFSQNDGSLFIKRRVVFRKWRVVFSPKQDTRCTTTKHTDIYSLGKSSHSINLSSRKYQEENRRINLAQR